MCYTRMGKTCWVTKFPGHLLGRLQRLSAFIVDGTIHLEVLSTEEKCHHYFLDRETEAQCC